MQRESFLLSCSRSSKTNLSCHFPHCGWVKQHSIKTLCDELATDLRNVRRAHVYLCHIHSPVPRWRRLHSLPWRLPWPYRGCSLSGRTQCCIEATLRTAQDSGTLKQPDKKNKKTLLLWAYRRGAILCLQKKNPPLSNRNVSEEMCLGWPQANLEPNWTKTSEEATTQTVAFVVWKEQMLASVVSAKMSEEHRRVHRHELRKLGEFIC